MKLEKITIGICPGDGIGPIIMREAERLMRILLRDEIDFGKVVVKKIDGLTIFVSFFKDFITSPLPRMFI